jgi:hypothetical protein
LGKKLIPGTSSLFVVVHWKQMADLAMVLEELGYVNIMPVYWHKLGHKPQVMVHQFAPVWR